MKWQQGVQLLIPQVKLGLKVLLVGMVLFAVHKIYGAIYSSGYNYAVIEQRELAETQREVAIAEARELWEKNNTIAAAEIIIEDRIVEKIRVVEKRIPFVVEKIVEVLPECSDLGPDFVLLYNQAVSASYHNESGSSKTSTFAAETLHTDGDH